MSPHNTNSIFRLDDEGRNALSRLDQIIKSNPKEWAGWRRYKDFYRDLEYKDNSFSELMRGSPEKISRLMMDWIRILDRHEFSRKSFDSIEDIRERREEQLRAVEDMPELLFGMRLEPANDICDETLHTLSTIFGVPNAYEHGFNQLVRRTLTLSREFAKAINLANSEKKAAIEIKKKRQIRSVV
jgi:hypothetical protein